MGVVFFTPGEPAPKGSKTRNTFGNGLREANPKTMPWVQAVAWSARAAAQTQGRIDGLVLVSVLFQFPRLASHYKTTKTAGTVLKPDAPVGKRGKPDVDKMLRAMLDGITDGGLWRDDSYCFAVTGMKVHVGVGSMLGAMCRLYSLDEMHEWVESVSGLAVVAGGEPHPLWVVPDSATSWATAPPPHQSPRTRLGGSVSLHDASQIRSGVTHPVGSDTSI